MIHFTPQPHPNPLDHGTSFCRLLQAPLVVEGGVR